MSATAAASPPQGAGGAFRWSANEPRSLASRIAWTGSLVTLAFVLAVGSVSYYVARSGIVDNVSVTLEHEARLRAEHVESRLGGVMATLGPLASNALLLNSLMDSFTRTTSLAPFLEDLSSVNGVPVTVALTEFEGNPIAGDGRMLAGYDEWKDTVLEAGQTFVAVRATTDGASLFVAEPMVYSVLDSPEGALIYQLPLGPLMGRAMTSDTSATWWRLLYTGGELQLRSDAPAASGGQDALTRTHALDVPDALRPLNLRMEGLAGAELLAEPLSRLFRLYALSGTLLVACVLGLTIAASRHLSRPLRALERVASLILRSGSLDHRFPTVGTRETARVGEAFNRMLEHLASANAQLAEHARQERSRVDRLGQLNEALQIEIGERQRSERELTRRSEELTQSNEELQRFAYVASHDLQEPLRKVRAFGGLLEKEMPDSLTERARDYLRRMTAACGRMQTLIDDLLVFSQASQTGTTTVEPVPLGEVVQQVSEDLEYAIAQTGARLRYAGLPTVRGDRIHLRQLVQNLLGNSIKYRREGVVPEIEIAARPPREADAAAGLCEITVRDNGIGFDPEYAERVFGVFQRLHGRHEYDGTGIGLAICRRIVENWGGSIRATSTPGEGTAITFTIRLEGAAAAAPTVAAATT